MKNQINTIEILESDIDPFKLLGLPFAAENREIETAWHSLPEEKKGSDDYINAYRMIGTPESRELYLLLSPSSPEDLDALALEIPRKPRYSGPEIWYRTLAQWLENEDTE